MNFDPAIAAQEALVRAYTHDSLGDTQPAIEEAEETFSSETGLEAKRAYETPDRHWRRSAAGPGVSGVSHFHHVAAGYGRNDCPSFF